MAYTKISHELKYTSLVTPGVVPIMIGNFVFNTKNTQTFDLGGFIPKTAREISVSIFIRSGAESSQSAFNVWLWTELNNGQKDVKFKRGFRYPQNAFSFDSETFKFSYSPEHSKLYLKSDMDAGKHMTLELFAIGYAE